MAAVTMDMIKALREITHAGIMDCKKALQESDGDFDKAEEYLKKVGLAAVEKRVDRATDNGRVTFVVAEKKAVMVEVSCETDFVAKNEQFKQLGDKLCVLAIEKGYKEQRRDAGTGQRTDCNNQREHEGQETCLHGYR